MEWRGWGTEALDAAMGIISFAPGILLALFVAYYHERRGLPRWTPGLYYLAGLMVGAGGAMIVGLLVFEESPIGLGLLSTDDVLAIVLHAPIVEEVTKLLGFWLVVRYGNRLAAHYQANPWHQRVGPTHARHVWLLGLVVGTGFAGVETYDSYGVPFAEQWGYENGIKLVGIRAVTTIAHASSTAIACVGLWLSIQERDWKPTAATLALAVGLHSLHNYVAYTSTSWYSLLYGLVAVAGTLTVAAIVGRRSGHDSARTVDEEE